MNPITTTIAGSPRGIRSANFTVCRIGAGRKKKDRFLHRLKVPECQSDLDGDMIIPFRAVMLGALADIHSLFPPFASDDRIVEGT